MIRCVIPEDGDLLTRFYYRLSPQTQEMRFFCHNRLEVIVQSQAQRLVNVDPAMHLALVATVEEDGAEQAVGVARYARDDRQAEVAEFAIVLRDDFQQDGLGRQMLRILIQAAKANGVKTLRIVWRSQNKGIQRLIQNTLLPQVSDVRQGETITLLTL